LFYDAPWITQGGCNGARIRFSPGKDWEPNLGLDATIAKLEPIFKKHENLSYSDLIVLAGSVAAERAGSPKLKFCPGRTDATSGSGWKHLNYGNDKYPATVDEMTELYQRRGQTSQEFVAMSFVVYKSSKELGKMLQEEGHGDSVLEEGLKFFPDLRQWADYYVGAGTDEYAGDFAVAWTKLMNADRFDGPVKNACAE